MDNSQPPTKKKKTPAMLKVIKPKTINQQKIFDAFDEGKHLFIHGAAGTGKTFCALYLALDAVVNDRDFRQVVIIRSTVPARQQGYLPGNAQEKDEIYEAPYDAMIGKLYMSSTPQAGKKYRDLKNEGTIKFMSTSYLRGITLENSLIIVDEVQNMNDMEINTVITRVGENCQLILIGDTQQNDLMYLKEDSCIEILPQIIHNMPSFEMVEMTTKDNQRNELVGEWIDARHEVTLPEPYWMLRKKGIVK